MKATRTEVSSKKAIVVIAIVCTTITGIFWSAKSALGSDTASPANLSPALQEIVKLAQAHLGDEVIMAYIRNSGASYMLSADDIVYLKGQGVSQNVISALLQKGSAGAPAAPAGSTPPPPPPPSASPPEAPAPSVAPSETSPPSPPPPPAPPEVGSEAPPPESAPAPAGEPPANLEYFQQQLLPYGAWVNVPGYGTCWQPSGIAYGWRPYYDNGYWVYTDAGMYWQSGYAWGAIPFHYGRWSYATGYGWVWSPAYVYAPAWVVWRHTDDYCGWAPLPYGAVFADGGWAWHGRHYGAEFDFGFGDSFFIFVGNGHLWDHDYRHYTLRSPELHAAFRVSVVNRARVDEHGHFVHEGFDRAHLEHVTGRSITVVRHDEIRDRARETMQVDHDRAVHSERRGEPRRDDPAGRDHGRDRDHDRQGP